MLADAVRAEGYRVLKDRRLLFFSLLLTPLLFAIGGVVFHVLTKARGDELAAGTGLAVAASSAPVNLAEALTFGANHGANGLILVFMLVAAATLYAGDYRWETWRLISARNGRATLILGKLLVLAALALAAMAAFLVASFAYHIAQAVVFERSLSFELEAGQIGQFALLWLLSWVRIIQFTMIALLTAVVSRSLLAALFAPWALGFVQSLLGQILPLFGWEPQMWMPQLLLPGLAYDTLKAFVAPGPAAPPLTDATMWRALIGLALWTLAPLAATLAWFRRQDLSKE